MQQPINAQPNANQAIIREDRTPELAPAYFRYLLYGLFLNFGSGFVGWMSNSLKGSSGTATFIVGPFGVIFGGLLSLAVFIFIIIYVVKFFRLNIHSFRLMGKNYGWLIALIGIILPLGFLISYLIAGHILNKAGLWRNGS